MSEAQDVIITLVDENEEQFDAILYDSIEYDGKIYNLFIPAEEKDKEDPQVIIMEYIEQGGDITLEPVENEVLLDEIWSAYMELDEE